MEKFVLLKLCYETLAYSSSVVLKFKSQIISTFCIPLLAEIINVACFRICKQTKYLCLILNSSSYNSREGITHSDSESRVDLRLLLFSVLVTWFYCLRTLSLSLRGSQYIIALFMGIYQFQWLNLERLWVLKTKRLLTSHKLELQWWIIKRAWPGSLINTDYILLLIELHCLWEMVTSLIQMKCNIWWQVAFNYILHLAQLTSLYHKCS